MAGTLRGQDKPEIMPLRDVKPGMHGVAYTIFTGDKIESMDVEIIGVLPNALGPKTDIILAQLKGEKVEHSGVVAGMSGSPVYIDGKLVGAISLKLGEFTKEAIAGITPIEEMLEAGQTPAPGTTVGKTVAANALPQQIALPTESASRAGLGAGNILVPIETPLIFSGVLPETIARFSEQLTGFGMSAMPGGTAPASPDDIKIQPGDMVGMSLVRGDLNLAAGCSVTAVIGDRVFVCGHPLFAAGGVSMPMVRGHVLLTLNSEQASTKIMTTGGDIGTVTQDRLTAVMGRLGAPPTMIPMDLELTTPAQVKNFHFDLMQDPRLTPVLVGLVTYNGLVANTAYGENTTLQMTAEVDIHGHTPLKLETFVAPTDQPIPGGIFIATAMQADFTRIFTNPYEQPQIERIAVKVTSLPERRWASIEGAWSEKSMAAPGETLNIKVLLRPYRGEPVIREVPITIPAQAAHGSLRVLVSDGGILNRMNRGFAGASQLSGLEELIQLLNKERRVDRLYVTLLQPSPTLLVEDKELPDVPPSALNVFDPHGSPGGVIMLGESEIGQWSLEMNQVISGLQYLTIQVK